MRLSLFRLSAVAILLGSATLAGSAQETAYRQVLDWPLRNGRQAPDYGTAAVMGVAVDAAGRVYVLQRAVHPVLVFDRDGHFLRSWGQGLFTAPHGCRIDPQGSLWLTDTGDHQVMRFTTGGRLLATYGTRNRPGRDQTHFNQPADIAFGPSGDIYIADGYGNARVVRLSASGKYLGAWGRRGTGPGEFRLVHSIAVDASGHVYVVDRANARIQVFSPEGRFLTQWRHIGHPFGLYLTRDQKLFVADGIANAVSIYTLQGKRLARWGGARAPSGPMRRAHLLTVDDTGAVYVAEVEGKRVRKFLPARPR